MGTKNILSLAKKPFHPKEKMSLARVVFHNEGILQQLMETDEYDKLRVWTSDVEKEFT